MLTVLKKCMLYLMSLKFKKCMMCLMDVHAQAELLGIRPGVSMWGFDYSFINYNFRIKNGLLTKYN